MTPARARKGPEKVQRRIGIDTGGTFTDLVELDDGELRLHKTASTPHAPEEAVCRALAESANGSREAGVLVHGSTVGLNALLTGQGARLALVTNAGFEDLIEIGRQERPELYALHVGPKAVLVPRKRRFGIHERRLANGKLRERASREELRALKDKIQRSGAQAVAVCLLHSWAWPEDEQRIAHALRGLRIPIVCSAKLLRRHREFERFQAACIDAFIRPVVSRYLQALAQRCAPLELSVVRNEGGTLAWQEAALTPVRAILSGPAGGATGARYWAQRVGHERAIGFDMGGTSADVALCGDAREVEDEARLGPYTLALPSLPLTTVGTGGGSIAWKDVAGALRVGPLSAGAEPGPACYGKGSAATVSDAHLFLGRLPEWGLLGGAFRLHPERAIAAIQDLALSLDLSPERCAEGILEIADLQMARPLRAFTLGRGVDPEHVALVAFGGAGGLHAVRLARLVGFTTVLLPPMQGVLSAFGMLLEQRVFEREQAALLAMNGSGPRTLARLAKSFLAESKQLAETRIRAARVLATLRYRGQEAEFWVDANAQAPESFVRAFEQRFGFTQDLPIEALRIRARLLLEEPHDEAIHEALTKTQPSKHEAYPDRLSEHGLRCIARSQLSKTRWRKGPFAIVDYAGTTIIEEQSRARLRDGCVEIQVTS